MTKESLTRIPHFSFFGFYRVYADRGFFTLINRFNKQRASIPTERSFR
jgi:hypothetical protein